jgi:hypothetical protein
MAWVPTAPEPIHEAVGSSGLGPHSWGGASNGKAEAKALTSDGLDAVGKVPCFGRDL